MRTTIELPDELFRQAKARAALSGTSLKALITHWVRRGLETADDPAPPARTARRTLPVIVPPRGRRMPVLTNAEIEALLESDDPV
jgi:hypothetical protein